MTTITLADTRTFIDALGDIIEPEDLRVRPEFYATLKENYPAPAYHPETGKQMDGLGLLQGIRVIIDKDLPVPWRFQARAKP